MEPQVNPLVWAVPLCPLVGFLINAFMGAKLTKSPRPVVETGPIAPAAPKHDGSEYDMELAGESEEAEDHHAHGHAHAGAHLDKGGLAIVGGIATAAVALAFVFSLILFGQVQGASGQVFSSAFNWMQVPSVGGLPALDLSFRLTVDHLSALMLLIITGVGTLIHLYSVGYMSHDKGYARYFAYLNLFVLFMLLLVMGSNFLVMFTGWEGVGLASYLLIGFWYERKSATDAAKKAFIVNRIGDAGLLIALFLIYRFFGTFEYFGPGGVLTADGLKKAMDAGYSNAGAFFPMAVNLVPLLLFLGAAGKSAQIPLYVWLPDAMEGPTPVSALIHAATMVTAGVYLLSRTHSLFLLSPTAMTVVAIIGLATALLAATIALVQNDIKKVLAYSTVSQLGYMFLACGVGAFSTAMFHVLTHAFFKALLFLGAGSVIHAMSGEQDMRKMGGLAKKIPVTYWTMVIGTVAIAGIPPFAGFWSKDEILLNAYADPSMGGMGSHTFWIIGYIVSGLTAFYMVRMMMKTFGGAPRYDAETAAHIHESPATMTIPLGILAVLSIGGGFLKSMISGYLAQDAGQPVLRAEGIEMTLLIASAALAIIVSGIAMGVYWNKANGDLIPESAKRRNPLWQAASAGWGVDEAYYAIFVRGGRRLANFLWRVVDKRIVDGVVTGAAGLVRAAAETLKGWQSGYVRNYALSMLVGVALVVVGCLIGWSTGLR